MPDITPKPPEVVEAQLATFAAEHVKHHEDRGYIFNNLGTLVVEGLGDVTRVTEAAEHHKDENGKTIRVPEGTEVGVATSDDYVNFLRSVGGSRYEAIQGRADILTAYDRFAPAVSTLKEELTDPETRKEHPSFLGAGASSMAFSVSVEGKNYAVRVPKGKKVDPELIDGHLDRAILGRGVPHLEQIVAASYEDGVTVAEVVPGKVIGNLAASEIQGITDTQLSELADTLVTARERGIAVDGKTDNFLYDSRAGFGILDYQSAKPNSSLGSRGDAIAYGTHLILNAGSRRAGFSTEPEDYAHDLELHKTHLDLFMRYRTIVDEKLAGGDRKVALGQVDSDIQAAQKHIDNLSNPQFVAAQIETAKKQKSRARVDDPELPLMAND